jgi:hypothetical protein
LRDGGLRLIESTLQLRLALPRLLEFLFRLFFPSAQSFDFARLKTCRS